MLRISTLTESCSTVTLKLEGRIVADWVSVLERECRRWVKERRKILLDLSEVRFVDGQGLEVLKRMQSENLEIINSPVLLRELLKGGEDR